ncbi:MAG: 50S ribosome-binding GTPase [Deltaproteobacteria bacterium]|nr:50S ribosome-binding GTPase [Deltaproteobacteria bacterium]
MNDASDQENERLTKDEMRQLKEAVLAEMSRNPPTIGIIGTSGTGKSSTLNAMFRTDLEISHVVACTKEFLDTDLSVEVHDGAATGEAVRLRVVDAPGLGEDVNRDPAYLEMYEKQLERCDIVLWVIAARNRAIALDQQYLLRLKSFHGRLVFGVNQVDLVEPCDWSSKTNLPSLVQEQHIAEIVADRKSRIESVVGREITIVQYSAQRKYNLQELFTAMIESCDEERAWIFSAVKGFRPEDFLPDNVRNSVMSAIDEQRGGVAPAPGPSGPRFLGRPDGGRLLGFGKFFRRPTARDERD